jgi:DNA polymerase III epsilon subunit-like protein
MADKYNFLNFTLFDFETSGLDYINDRIIEACVIRVRDGIPTMMFNCMVSHEDLTISPKITELTGHTQGDMELGIPEHMLAAILANMMPDDELLVAYNAGFDMSFLDALLDRHGYAHLYNDFIDPLTIARDRSPYPHKLGDMCKKMGIVLEDAHSAEADTMALMELVIAMHKEKDISEYVNVMGYRRKYGEPAWIPDHATLKPQGTEIIEHTSKPKIVKPKSQGAVVTKNTRKKRVPDDPKQFEREAMPSALLPKHTKDRIDNWLSGKDTSIFLELNVLVEDEFDQTMKYLTEVCNIPEDSIESSLDNPEEAIIIIDALPF